MEGIGPVVGRWTRRNLTRAGLLGAAAVAAGTALTACGPTAARSTAPPTAAQPKTRLVLQVSWQGGIDYPGKAPQQLTETFIAQNWSSKHPGVEVTTQAGAGSNGASVSASSAIAAVLAGVGPDILVACCNDVPGLFAANILAPLDPYIKQDNVDVTTLFPASILDGMSFDGKLYGLPDYGSTGPFYVNYSMLDELGLPYPDPTWTYTEAAEVWRSVAGNRKGKWGYGALLPVESGASATWLVRGWGGAARDATRARCLLDSAPCAAAYTWLASLAQPKIVNPCLWCLGNTPIVLLQGQAAFTPGCCGTLQSAALTLADKVKWDLLPMPSFPAGKTNFIGYGMYGMNALSKNPPDLVWDLFRFVTTTLTWQHFFNAQLALMPPPMQPEEGWDDWMTIVRSVAPPLKDKHLEYFRGELPGSYAWSFYKYKAAQAEQLWEQTTTDILAGKVSAEEGLSQLARQINGMQAAGAAEEAGTGRMQQQFPTDGPAIASEPAGV